MGSAHATELPLFKWKTQEKALTGIEPASPDYKTGILPLDDSAGEITAEQEARQRVAKVVNQVRREGFEPPLFRLRAGSIAALPSTVVSIFRSAWEAEELNLVDRFIRTAVEPSTTLPALKFVCCGSGPGENRTLMGVG